MLSWVYPLAVAAGLFGQIEGEDSRILLEYLKRQDVATTATRVGKTNAHVYKLLVRQAAPMLLNTSEFAVFRDDFYQFNTVATTGQWTVDSDGATGAAALFDIDTFTGGLISVATAAANNDYHGYGTPGESFSILDGKYLYAECKLVPPVSNTNVNLYFGLSDDESNIMGDNGGGPPASYDGILINKLDGNTTWDFETSNATTQNTGSALVAVNDGTGSDVLGFLIDTNDGTTAIVTPYINGTAYTAQNLTLSGLQATHLVFGVKAGDTTARTIGLDYVYVVQVR